MSAVLPSSKTLNLITTDDIPCPLIKEQVAVGLMGVIYVVGGIAATIFGFRQEGWTTAALGVLQIAWCLLSLRVRLIEDQYIHDLSRMHNFAQNCLTQLKPLEATGLSALKDGDRETTTCLIRTFYMKPDTVNKFPLEALRDLNKAFKNAKTRCETFERNKTVNNLNDLNSCSQTLPEKLSSFLTRLENEAKQARLRLEDTSRFF
jgi:hypothetical protein